MDNPDIALVVAGFITLLSVGGSIIGFMLKSARLKDSIEQKGADRQKVLDCLNELKNDVSELKNGQSLTNAALNELQQSQNDLKQDNQKEHSELDKRLALIEQFMTSIAETGCKPAKAQAKS